MTDLIVQDFGQYIVQYSERNAIMANQVVLRFPNNFGVSVIRGALTHGGSEGLFEAAVIHFYGPSEDDFVITYETPVAEGDVLGGLDAGEVRYVFHEVLALPARGLTDKEAEDVRKRKELRE